MRNNFSAPEGRPTGRSKPRTDKASPEITAVDSAPTSASSDDVAGEDSPPATLLTNDAPVLGVPGGAKMLGGASLSKEEKKDKEREKKRERRRKKKERRKEKKERRKQREEKKRARKAKEKEIGSKKQTEKSPTVPSLRTPAIEQVSPEYPKGDWFFGEGTQRKRRPYEIFGGDANNDSSDPLDTGVSASEDPPETAGASGENLDADDFQRYLKQSDSSWRTGIQPGWAQIFRPLASTGIINEGDVCYRNVILQMLLHLPVFMNWLLVNKGLHVGIDVVCAFGPGRRICKPCQFISLTLGYWDPLQVPGEHVHKLWQDVFADWNGGANRGQQDAAEFWPELLRQLKADTKLLVKSDLDTIFTIPTVNMVKCRGTCPPRYHLDQTDFLRIHLTKGAEDPNSIRELLRKCFHAHVIDGNCARCNTPRVTQVFLRHPPEALLVHLNRIEVRDKKPEKITDEIKVKETIKLNKKWFDPRVPGRKTLRYELSSIILHQGDSTQAGHYRIVAKNPGGQWVLLDDDATPTVFASFKDVSRDQTIRSEAYIFAYRRMPVEPDYIGNFEAELTEEVVEEEEHPEEKVEVYETNPDFEQWADDPFALAAMAEENHRQLEQSLVTAAELSRLLGRAKSPRGQSAPRQIEQKQAREESKRKRFTGSSSESTESSQGGKRRKISPKPRSKPGTGEQEKEQGGKKRKKPTDPPPPSPPSKFQRLVLRGPKSPSPSSLEENPPAKKTGKGKKAKAAPKRAKGAAAKEEAPRRSGRKTKAVDYKE